MEFEFMTAGTALPPCMPLPPVLLRLPTSSTAKVMYARMLEEMIQREPAYWLWSHNRWKRTKEEWERRNTEIQNT